MAPALVVLGFDPFKHTLAETGDVWPGPGVDQLFLQGGVE